MNNDKQCNYNLSTEDAAVILELTPILNISFAKRLSKGCERKFYIETIPGEKLLLRINTTEHYDWLEQDFHMYEYVAAAGINIIQPIRMGTFHEGALSYQTYGWIEGEDLTEALSHMTPAKQYLSGIKAGQLMRKLHTLPPIHEYEPWNIKFGRKVQEIIQSYRNKQNKSKEIDLLIQYLDRNQALLNNREQTFTHGDWNTENLIFTPDEQIAMIDLSGENDYGDPWWEFWLIPHNLDSSAHFYTGQINGYFEDKPTMAFFQLLSYYLTYSTLEFLDDSNLENVKTLLHWFDQMRNPIPSWYLKDYNA